MSGNISGKTKTIRSVLLCLFICLCLLPQSSHAGTAVEGGTGVLSFSEALKVRAWVEPTEEVAVTQQVRFIIELSTPTWFTQGTRLENVEIADAVVQQAGQFATNFTRDDKGLTWSVQQWTFFLYPLKEKSYRIPEIVVAASISDGKGHTLSGKVRTKPVAFRAVIPETMRARGNWVATTRLAVREHYSVQKGKQEIGDAIERTIEIEADDLPAMMLPLFPSRAAPGLGIYQDPPKIIDEMNRGMRVGRRVEHITYLVEKRGAYCIPARVYSWFNVHTGRAEEISLPEKWLATEGYEPPSSPGEGARRERVVPLRHLAPILGAGLLLFAGAVLLRLRKRRTAAGSRPSEASLRRALKRAAKAGKNEEALRILYQWLDHYGTPGEACGDWRQFLQSRDARKELECFNHCMSVLYGPEAARTVSAKTSLRQWSHTDEPAAPCEGGWAALLDRRSPVRSPGGGKSASGKQDPLCEIPLF